MDADERQKELQRRYREAEQGGGKARIERQHQAGKLTARERIEFLLDPGTFQETDKLVVGRSTDLGVEQKKSPATVWSRVTVKLTADWFMSLLRTLPFLVEVSPRPMPPKSARSWTWP